MYCKESALTPRLASAEELQSLLETERVESKHRDDAQTEQIRQADRQLEWQKEQTAAALKQRQSCQEELRSLKDKYIKLQNDNAAAVQRRKIVMLSCAQKDSAIHELREALATCQASLAAAEARTFKAMQRVEQLSLERSEMVAAVLQNAERRRENSENGSVGGEERRGSVGGGDPNRVGEYTIRNSVHDSNNNNGSGRDNDGGDDAESDEWLSGRQRRLSTREHVLTGSLRTSLIKDDEEQQQQEDEEGE